LNGVHSSSCIRCECPYGLKNVDVELHISVSPGVHHDGEATLEESMTETSSVLAEGRQMPSFELPDEEGRRRKLLEYLDEGPVILVFYRGDW
jgi:hypothetical protein